MSLFIYFVFFCNEAEISISEVLTAVLLLRIPFFCDVTLCRCKRISRRFERSHCVNLQSNKIATVFRNVGGYSPNSTVAAKKTRTLEVGIVHNLLTVTKYTNLWFISLFRFKRFTFIIIHFVSDFSFYIPGIAEILR